MKIEVTKKYHFYAGHRNQYLTGSKCVNPHGHTYGIGFTFEFNQDAIDETGVTLPFEAFDSAIEPIIKQLDHSFFIDSSDTEMLSFFNKMNFKVNVIKGATSVEHLCLYFNKALEEVAPELHSFLTKISIKETESSVVTLTL